MLCKEVSIITWLRDIVQCELSINKYMYTHLLLKLQTQITTLDFLKEKLNTVKTKTVFQQKFIVIYCEFNNVFCNIFKSWKNKCLTFLTQWCNYNKWRQIKEKWIFRRVKDHDSALVFNVLQSFNTSLFFYIDNKKSELLKTVQNIMIQIHQNKNHSTSCKSQDLLSSEKIEDLIIINDLNFSKFILMIMKKLKYNDQQNIIVYECINIITMYIANKLKWRTALFEMHIKRFI